MEERNAVVRDGVLYYWIPDEQAWVDRDDMSMPGLIAPSRPRYTLWHNGGLSLKEN
jgi:hypothetical protein